jgi:hypothetical protein
MKNCAAKKSDKADSSTLVIKDGKIMMDSSMRPTAEKDSEHIVNIGYYYRNGEEVSVENQS